MINKDIEKCVVLYNPVSTGFCFSKLNKIKEVLQVSDIKTNFLPSNYEGHLLKLIKEVDDYNTLVLTLGGDGTVGEAYRSFNEIDQKGLYSHIPTGTTNDMAKNYNVNSKHIEQATLDIINGKVETNYNVSIGKWHIFEIYMK